MKKILFCILDGFGYSDKTYGNAVLEAKFLNELINSNNRILLEASGKYVGLPHGQPGNSEVGHLTIGAGRILKQKLPMINDAITSGELEQKITSNKIFENVYTVHLMGLFSRGGIHSNIQHYFWAIKLLRKLKINIKSHIFLDGRDVGYKDAINTLQKALDNDDIRLNEIATMQGRYYAMDRDKRNDRTQKAYDAIVNGNGEYNGNNPIEIVQYFYNKNIYDETIPPIILNNYTGAKTTDTFWMLNYRTDRIKQILGLLLDNNFKVINMIPCGNNIDNKSTVLLNQQEVNNTLGEVLSKHNIKQLRIAETEKYAHVTYFFNGGKEIQYPGEDRILVPSPKVSDYVETPDMSARNIVNEIVKAMNNSSHQVIIVNFSNPDMIGHTGNFKATQESLRLLDKHMQNIINSANKNKYITIISADHGNAENMINSDDTPQKSHTCARVPFIIVPTRNKLRDYGELSDIAPTILTLLGITIPNEMSGKNLLSINSSTYE